MIEVLRNKNLTTRFQILAEIANSGPGIQQRDIAEKLDITPQAVSDYISRLIKDKMLVSGGRSSYRVTNQGVNWIIKSLRELDSYNAFVQRAVTNISVSTALAETDLAEHQKVGLKMRDGLLYATADTDTEATGLTVAAAAGGEDVGITDIEGIVPLEAGRVTIVEVPEIQRGGSRRVDMEKLKANLDGKSPVTFLGLEALVALRRAGIAYQSYGAVEAVVEAARSGLNALVVCVENETAGLIKRLEREGVRYETTSAELNR